MKCTVLIKVALKCWQVFASPILYADESAVLLNGRLKDMHALLSARSARTKTTNIVAQPTEWPESETYRTRGPGKYATSIFVWVLSTMCIGVLLCIRRSLSATEHVALMRWQQMYLSTWTICQQTCWAHYSHMHTHIFYIRRTQTPWHGLCVYGVKISNESI